MTRIKNLVIIDKKLEISDILNDIKNRETVKQDGTFYIYIKTNALYVIANNNRFLVDEKPYVLINNKKEPISFIC
jgi:hypothetical protein